MKAHMALMIPVTTARGGANVSAMSFFASREKQEGEYHLKGEEGGDFEKRNALKQAMIKPIALLEGRGLRHIITKGAVKPMDMCRLRRSAWTGSSSQLLHVPTSNESSETKMGSK